MNMIIRPEMSYVSLSDTFHSWSDADGTPFGCSFTSVVRAGRKNALARV